MKFKQLLIVLFIVNVLLIVALYSTINPSLVTAYIRETPVPSDGCGTPTVTATTFPSPTKTPLPTSTKTPIPTEVPTNTPTPTPMPQPSVFIETFDGDPDHPSPWQPLNWDITVHSRNMSTWFTLESMDAQHGPNCEPPPATHFIASTYEDAVYQCKDHTMTAINASGYGLIYLTPNYLVDFSQGEAVIRWDMSTERSSQRDWIDIWVTPYDDNLQLTVLDWIPDLNGSPKNAVHIDMANSNGGTSFRGNIHHNFEETSLNSMWWVRYEDFLEPSAMRRDTFELRISQTHIKFGMPDYDFWWIDTDIDPLTWTQGIIQLGHHSYSPWKSGNGGPQTWHWDNVHITPAAPFTIIQADRRYVNNINDNTVNFPAPAPNNSHLRFAGIGGNLQVSFNNGNTWTDAIYQSHADSSFPGEAFVSYWMPIPAGTNSVQFRGENWWGGGWHFRDISIWSSEVP